MPNVNRRARLHNASVCWIRPRSSFQSSPSHVYQADDGRPSAPIHVVGDAVGRPRRRPYSAVDVRRRRAHPAALHPSAGRDPADAADTRRAAAARAEQRPRRRENALRHRAHPSTDVREPERAGDRHHRPVVDPGGSATAQHHSSQTTNVRATDSASADREQRRSRSRQLQERTRQGGGSRQGQPSTAGVHITRTDAPATAAAAATDVDCRRHINIFVESTCFRSDFRFRSVIVDGGTRLRRGVVASVIIDDGLVNNRENINHHHHHHRRRRRRRHCRRRHRHRHHHHHHRRRRRHCRHRHRHHHHHHHSFSYN